MKVRKEGKEGRNQLSPSDVRKFKEGRKEGRKGPEHEVK